MTVLIAVVFTIAVAVSAVCGWQACEWFYGLEIIEFYDGSGSPDPTVIERYEPRTAPVRFSIAARQEAGKQESWSVTGDIVGTKTSFSFSCSDPELGSSRKHVSMDIYDYHVWPKAGIGYFASDKDGDGRYDSQRLTLPQRESDAFLDYDDFNADGRPDMMWDSATREYHILVENSWRRVLVPHEDGESTRVLVGDKEVPVVFEDGCWREAETKDDTEV
jgi:hypothetical protein